MENVAKIPLKFQIRNYLQVSKPGIIFGNSVSAIGGFLLASKGSFNILVFLIMLVGLSCVIASACVFNNYIDRDIDAKMDRTKNRALVKGVIPFNHAIVFAMSLVVIGVSLLLSFTNVVTALLASFGFVIYVVFYSFLKHVSSHATLVGSFSGAIPPVIGYTSIKGEFDLGALILFVIFVMWQMPHFFAIALHRVEDYKKANIPVLPVRKGVFRTKLETLLYVVGFLVSVNMLFVFHYVNFVFLIALNGLSFFWLFLSITGFKAKKDEVWARKMFIFSLVIVMAITIVIPFSLT